MGNHSLSECEEPDESVNIVEDGVIFGGGQTLIHTDGQLRIRSKYSRREETFSSTSQMITSITKSGDGSIVVGLGDGSLEGYTISPDYRFNVEIPTVKGADSAIYGLDEFDDILVTGSIDKHVKVWKIRKEHKNPSFKCLHKFDDHSAGVYCIQILKHTSNWISSSNYDGRIRIHDLEAGKLVSKFRHHYHNVFTHRYDESMDVLYSCSFDKTIQLTHLKTKKPFQTFREEKGLKSLLFMSESHTLIVGEGGSFNGPRKLHLYDLDMMKKRASWIAHSDDINHLTCLKNRSTWTGGIRFLSGSDDARIKVWCGLSVDDEVDEPHSTQSYRSYALVNGLCYFEDRFKSAKTRMKKGKRITKIDEDQRGDFVKMTILEYFRDDQYLLVKIQLGKEKSLMITWSMLEF